MNGYVFSMRNKIGIGLAGLLAVADLPSLAFQTPDGKTGPPVAILALSSVCGVITLLAIFLGLRNRNFGAIRIAAGARIVSMLTTLPAFFVDVPGGIKMLAAGQVLITLTAVVLMLTPSQHAVTVTD